MVLLPVEQYQNLARSRRQAGAQGPQIQALKRALNDVDALLAEVEEALAGSAGPSGSAAELLVRIRAHRLGPGGKLPSRQPQPGPPADPRTD
ncbi:hypothetical protein OG455_33495 [Kitasatospora sp. NBC_01287]|uniref:hypothetical protein n=1 Tax=Kitasatospora sp. NBC_01287 TaxID=2903573 RepID=UPI00224DE67F|nr:hypothetical protein [Kitasatospora sp. NBC_01287]MCX4750369.1 hypothetical protein [Kitasatospora sp. NBC_01287]